jgi:hypothetical protein
MRTKKLPPIPAGLTELADEALDHVVGCRSFPFPQLGTVTAQFAFPLDKQKVVYAHGAPEPLGGAFTAGQGVISASYTPGGGPF